MINKLDKLDIYSLAKILVISLAVQLAVIVYVFYASYKGRQDLTTATRAGCDRNNVVRKVVVNEHPNTAHILPQVDCVAKYPKASLLP